MFSFILRVEPDGGAFTVNSQAEDRAVNTEDGMRAALREMTEAAISHFFHNPNVPRLGDAGAIPPDRYRPVLADFVATNAMGTDAHRLTQAQAMQALQRLRDQDQPPRLGIDYRLEGNYIPPLNPLAGHPQVHHDFNT